MKKSREESEGKVVFKISYIFERKHMKRFYDFHMSFRIIGNFFSVADPHWFQCGSGSMVLMTKNFQKKFASEKNYYIFDQNCSLRLLIPRPP
jgi:hypothetical protein